MLGTGNVHDGSSRTQVLRQREQTLDVAHELLLLCDWWGGVGAGNVHDGSSRTRVLHQLV